MDFLLQFDKAWGSFVDRSIRLSQVLILVKSAISDFICQCLVIVSEPTPDR